MPAKETDVVFVSLKLAHLYLENVDHRHACSCTLKRLIWAIQIGQTFSQTKELSQALKKMKVYVALQVYHIEKVMKFKLVFPDLVIP